MTEEKQKEAEQLHKELERLVLKLKHNREKVPLDVLKTKYAAGYTALSQKICRAASDYAKMVTLDGIRIYPEFAEEGIALVNDTIAQSGILKELSRSLFRQLDMALYDSLLHGFREKLIQELQVFYDKYTVLQADFDHPEDPPRKICLANNCFWQDGQWIPVETLHKEPTQKAV